MALQKRCINGHYYDPDQHTSCPHCGVPGLDVGKTVPKRPQASSGAPDADTSHTMPKDEPGGAEGRTKSIFESVEGFDPVVGWLVAIDGPRRGTDYRIRGENNSIGRGVEMRISIEGDEGISRENHAFISYDPRTNIYTLLPGIARGIVYRNKEPVYSPVRLEPFDEIMMGKTNLLFIPLCGEFGNRSFRWL